MTATVPIHIKKVAKSRIAELDINNLSFGKLFSDHMFIGQYHDGQWREANIMPYEKMLMSPSTSALHYGQAIFEGLKAYRNIRGEVVIFRPQANHKRINISAHRMAMPEIPEDLFLESMVQLLKLDKNWIPDKEGSSLYIRPLYFATDEFIGVKPSESYQLLTFTAPVGAYYNEPVKVMVEPNYFRAVEGGVGFVKASGNYGRSLHPSKLAHQKGYHQLIWTDARHHKYVEESGTMNLMFVINDTLITPPLSDTILAGITRDSVLTIARDWGMKVEERKISVDEIVEAIKNKSLQEAFGTGTAATIANICLIAHEEKDYDLPRLTDKSFSTRVAKELDDIKKGRVADKFGWIYKVC